MSKLDLPAFGRWMRDRFASLTAATISLTALWAAVIVACITLYIWDSTFYRAQAPEGMELTFWAAGIVFRTVVIFGLVIIVWAKASKAPRGWIATIRLLWVMGLIACFVAALGFITEGLDYRERRVGLVAGVETLTTSGAASQIEELKAQKAEIVTARDTTIAALQSSINGIVKDGLDNDHLADAYRVDQSAERDSARGKIDAIDARILELMATQQSAAMTATESATHETAIPVVFTFMAFGHDEWGRIIRNVFALFWTLLIELIGGLGAGALYGLHKHAEMRAAASANGAKGGNASARNNRRRRKFLQIEDYSKQKAAESETVELPDEDAIDEAEGAEDDGDADNLQDERRGPEEDQAERGV